METYLEPWRKFADSTGRASRREYWTFTLINAAIYIGLSIIGAMISGPRSESNQFQCLVGIFNPAALIPSIMVGIRRLHDIGRSGWWMLLNLAPCVGALVLLVFFLQPGDIGANQYGPDPYGNPLESQYSPTPPPPQAYSDLGSPIQSAPRSSEFDTAPSSEEPPEDTSPQRGMPGDL